MISRMIEGIRYADFSLSFSTQHKTRTEQRLAQEINNVVAEFRTRLSENEERYQYYETLLNTVDSSLLVVDSQCNIHWMNRAAMQDLCGYRIHSVRELALLNSDFLLLSCHYSLERLKQYEYIKEILYKNWLLRYLNIPLNMVRNSGWLI